MSSQALLPLQAEESTDEWPGTEAGARHRARDWVTYLVLAGVIVAILIASARMNNLEERLERLEAAGQER